ncbi:RNA polymerase sigma-70 factor (ECF subfamily) [Pedobacter sp. AK017]|uniref:RNA polymerase sigma-70 factor n=1 Tax=Pedobacter sp. AK017 TaxID=2723073 RepID=UPI0016096A09|nr:RNA polymerase sigma-70 factor [Pedobacter sp. AK017]MBB5439842.1 RNA polymerase sigma-70 factor (ECF subfamily) [Pedobacter sp. AK017]
MSGSTHHTAYSFEELFRDNYARLCHFALQFLKDDDAAKDIVQEVFVSYWNMDEKPVDDASRISSFLYAAVRNACLNKLRRQKLEYGFLNAQDADPSEDAVALNSMIRSEVISELHKVITTLPENCQKIFRMGYLEGLKNPQIAAELGLSINTVKTQKKRGLQLLRMRLNPDFFALISLFLLK